MQKEELERRRNWTLANACLAAFSFGLSVTIYFPTEFYYFRDTMKVSNPDFFYGLGWAFLCGSGVISSLMGSYYVDKTKNIREILLWTSFVNVIGNITYLLYFSPYIVLFGQLLVGTAAVRMVAVVGEVSRIYESCQVTQKIAFLGIFTSIGGLLAPCSTYLFSLVDLRIQDWVLNVNNFVGVVMAGLFLLQFWVQHFTLTNLSKEFNVKIQGIGEDEDRKELYESNAQDEIEVNEPDLENNLFRKRYLLALRTLTSSKQVMFLYMLSSFCSYCKGTVLLLLTMKSSLYLGWLQIDQATYNIISASAGI